MRQYVYTGDVPVVKRPVLDMRPSPRAVLAFVKSRLEAGSPFPSAYDIANHMGWTKSSAAIDALYRLAADGHIRHRGRCPTGFRKILWELVP